MFHDRDPIDRIEYHLGENFHQIFSKCQKNPVQIKILTLVRRRWGLGDLFVYLE